MDKNQRYIVIAVAIIALIAGWQLLKKPTEVTQENQIQNQENSSEETQEKTTPIKVVNSTEKNPVWTGVLKTSDNPKKGNLMLVTKDRTVYLKTSRDFSTLLNKEVNVSYEGDFTNFVLGNITLK
jgi:uncharacterized protein with NAD-binding domain and iron-sulfur cluster